jgi:hypothetical protein
MTEAIEDLQQPVADTVLLRDEEIELLTSTPELPVVSMQAGNRAEQSAGVLIR